MKILISKWVQIQMLINLVLLNLMVKCLYLVDMGVITISRYYIFIAIFFNTVNIEIQISKIENCGLQRIGELPNEFDFGACGTFKFAAEERVMFCFPDNESKKCFR